MTSQNFDPKFPPQAKTGVLPTLLYRVSQKYMPPSGRDEKRWLQSTEKRAVWSTINVDGCTFLGRCRPASTILLVDVDGTFHDQNPKGTDFSP